MAANVRLGDELNVINCADTQRVTQITTVYKTGGTFAPFTRSGSIVVNGVVASTYSGDYYSATLDGAEVASAQAVAKIALAPLAAFHALLTPCPMCNGETCIEVCGVGAEGTHPYAYVFGLQRIGEMLKWLKKGCMW